MDNIAEAARFLWMPLSLIFGLLITMLNISRLNQRERIERLEKQQQERLTKLEFGHSELSNAISLLTIDMAKNYVTREEIHQELTVMNAKLDKIFDKLERKADKL